MDKISIISIIIYIIVTSKALGQVSAPIGGGLEVPTVDDFRKSVREQIAPGASQFIGYPPVVDLSKYIPTPGNQGINQNCCSAWAVAYGLKSFQEAVESKLAFNPPIKDEMLFSPSFMFNKLQKDNNKKCSEGIKIKDALVFLQENGAVSIKDMPYDPNDCSLQPSPLLFQKSKKYKILNHNFIYSFYDNQFYGVSPTVESVKEKISLGYPEIEKGIPVIIGITIDEQFKNDIFEIENHNGKQVKVWRKFTGLLGTPTTNNYHAMLIVGYDDDLSAFKVLNSYGPNVGDGGFIWVSYNVFLQAVREIWFATDQDNNTVVITTPNGTGIRKNELYQQVNFKDDISISLINRNNFPANRSKITEYYASRNVYFSKKREIHILNSMIDTTIRGKELVEVNSENTTNLKDKGFISYNLLKKGVNKDIDNLRLNLLEINVKDSFVIVSLGEKANDDKSITEFSKLKIGLNGHKAISYNGTDYFVKLNKLSEKKSAYITISRNKSLFTYTY